MKATKKQENAARLLGCGMLFFPALIILLTANPARAHGGKKQVSSPPKSAIESAKSEAEEKALMRRLWFKPKLQA